MLRQDAQDVLAALPTLSDIGRGERGTGDGSLPPKISHELMQSTLELRTGVCSTVAEVKADLAATIEHLKRVTGPRGMMLACAGTHPLSDWRDAKVAPVQRYAELVEQMQWLVRRIQTFSVQVHVGLADRDRVMPVINALARYLPHFLALTASSPF